MSVWRLRSSMKVCGKRIMLRLQFHNRRAAAALILRSRRVTRYMRMIGEQFSDRPAQRTRAVAVDYAHFKPPVQECGVEKFVDEIGSLVGGFADHINLAGALGIRVA